MSIFNIFNIFSNINENKLPKTKLSDDKKHITDVPVIFHKTPFIPGFSYDIPCHNYKLLYLLHTYCKRGHPVCLVTHSMNSSSKKIGVLCLGNEKQYKRMSVNRKIEYVVNCSKRITLKNIHNGHCDICYCDGDVIEDKPLDENEKGKFNKLVKDILLLGILSNVPLVNLSESYEAQSFTYFIFILV